MWAKLRKYHSIQLSRTFSRPSFYFNWCIPIAPCNFHGIDGKETTKNASLINQIKFQGIQTSFMNKSKADTYTPCERHNKIVYRIIRSSLSPPIGCNEFGNVAKRNQTKFFCRTCLRSLHLILAIDCESIQSLQAILLCYTLFDEMPTN